MSTKPPKKAATTAPEPKRAKPPLADFVWIVEGDKRWRLRLADVTAADDAHMRQSGGLSAWAVWGDVTTSGTVNPATAAGVKFLAMRQAGEPVSYASVADAVTFEHEILLKPAEAFDDPEA